MANEELTSSHNSTKDDEEEENESWWTTEWKNKTTTIHIMTGEKTENNKTDHDVSEEYRKHAKKM